MDEIRRWASSPIDVDTDDDSQGNPSLFDGSEVSSQGTSPTLDDSDGNGISDFEGIIQLGNIFDPTIVNVPQIELSLVGDTNITLDVVFTESNEIANTLETSLQQGESSEFNTTGTNSHEVSAELSVEVGAKTEATAGIPSSVSSELSVEVKATAGYTFNTTRSVSETSVTSSQETYSEALQESRTEGKEIAGGKIIVGVKIRNAGGITFNVADFIVTALLRDPDNPAAFKPMASLEFPGSLDSGIGLRPNPSTGVLTAEALIDAPTALQLLANPQSLFFEFGNAVLNYENPDPRGLRAFFGFEFLRQTTNAQTALVQIYYDNGNVRHDRVATNIRREEGQIGGVTFGEVLENMLEIPFVTATQLVNGVPGSTVLTSLYDRQNNVDITTNDTRIHFWAVGGISGNHTNPLLIEVDIFDDIVLHGGDTIYILYVRDEDRDNLFAREEYLYGTSDTDVDSDDDGIHGGDESKVGWNVLARVRLTPSRRMSSPTPNAKTQTWTVSLICKSAN